MPFGVYVASLRPGVDFWDTGELQTVPYILGIPHPTGFPAYVLIGWAWTHVLPLGDPAYRMNLLSAAGVALAAAALAGTLVEWDVEPLFALGAALVFAFARIVWDHATRADVHAVALAALGFAFWLALRWRRTRDAQVLVGCGIAAAAALAVHSGTILVLPGIAMVALARRPSPREALAAIAAGAVVVAAFYAYLPIRSAIVTAERRDPTLALGVAPGRPFWDHNHPSTPAGFRAEVTGGEFGVGRALRSIVKPENVADLPARYGRGAARDLALGVLAIALVGAVVVLRRSALAGAGLIAGAFLPVLFVLAFHAESDPERYFLPSYWIIAALLGIGADMLARGGDRAPRGVVALVTVLLVFVAGTNVYVSRDRFAAPRSETAQPFIDRVARVTPDRAVIVVPWLYATALAYGAYVEHRLGDRIVLTGWASDYEGRYERWLAERPVVVVSDGPFGLPGLTLRDLDAIGEPHLYAVTVAR